MRITKEALAKCLNGTREERVFLCEQSFLLFCVVYFNDYFKYAFAPFHHDMGDDIEDLLSGKIRECLWVMFRESAKTTFAKILIIYLICYGKRKYINTDSFDSENSERILFDVAFELVNNARLRADFGALFQRAKGLEEIKQNRIDNFITENGVRVEAHSTQESMRGRIHLDQRPDFLLIDDFETNKTKDSAAYTKQVAQHLSEAVAGMAPNGVILYLGNYITEYGNIQALMERAKNDHRLRVRNVPVMVDGVPTWPAKYALTDVEAEKTGKVSIEDRQRQLGSLVFNYEMMNTPIDDKIAEFKKEWIQRADESLVQQLDTLTFITIDPNAGSKDVNADDIGITINRVSTENKWYLTAYKLHVDSAELIKHIFYLQETYNPEVIGIEETVFTLAIKPFLDEEMRKRNKFFTITPLKHNGTKKETRIRGLQPKYESRSVFHVGDCSALEEQMRVFPRGIKDDVLDSTAYQLQIAYKPHKLSDFKALDEPIKPLHPQIGI